MTRNPILKYQSKNEESHLEKLKTVSEFQKPYFSNFEKSVEKSFETLDTEAKYPEIISRIPLVDKTTLHTV